MNMKITACRQKRQAVAVFRYIFNYFFNSSSDWMTVSASMEIFISSFTSSVLRASRSQSSSSVASRPSSLASSVLASFNALT